MPANDDSLTIDEFCAAEKLSRGKLYGLWAEGRGPRYFCIGNRRRVSQEARIEWRRKLEAESEARRNQPHKIHEGGRAMIGHGIFWALAAGLTRQPERPPRKQVERTATTQKVAHHPSIVVMAKAMEGWWA